jgi:hypothetical protein
VNGEDRMMVEGRVTVVETMGAGRVMVVEMTEAELAMELMDPGLLTAAA